MPRFRLRTLLMALALMPPLLWAGYWGFVLIEETFLRGLGPSSSTVEELRRLERESKTAEPSIEE